jgi:hypothetical protein
MVTQGGEPRGGGRSEERDQEGQAREKDGLERVAT